MGSTPNPSHPTTSATLILGKKTFPVKHHESNRFSVLHNFTQTGIPNRRLTLFFFCDHSDCTERSACSSSPRARHAKRRRLIKNVRAVSFILISMLIWLPTLEIWRYRKFPSYTCELAFITPHSLPKLFIFILPCAPRLYCHGLIEALSKPHYAPRLNCSFDSLTSELEHTNTIRIVHHSRMTQEGEAITQNLWRCEDN